MGEDDARIDAADSLDEADRLLYALLITYVEEFRRRMLQRMPSVHAAQGLHLVCDRLADQSSFQRSLAVFRKHPERRAAFETVLRSGGRMPRPDTAGYHTTIAAVLNLQNSPSDSHRRAG